MAEKNLNLLHLATTAGNNNNNGNTTNVDNGNNNNGNGETNNGSNSNTNNAGTAVAENVAINLEGFSFLFPANFLLFCNHSKERERVCVCV